ncbi:hypothetical protein D1164_18520 [Mariniphaga sediminis]|uniref:Pectate lyase superfamily protein domain-containing protein n=1 Tax=Mariniphaga sediminis TaxID=1628158 RepID=A0A399CW26_9BACT|nr:hypothetical protein [Mariniphaga sediminis]RIH63749.1 hypothetical protein D1164_18520 [Mariniphaga sediminis]
MKGIKLLLLWGILAGTTPVVAKANVKTTKKAQSGETTGFVDVASFGFSPDATGMQNTTAMQKAIDEGGAIIVSQPGVYKIASTLYIGSHTSIIFGDGVSLKKVDEKGPFAQVIINKGALTKSYDENITLDGLHVIVNGVDNCSDLILGLRGVLGFSYVKDLRVKGLRCYDLTGCQYCLQVSRFEDVTIEDVIIKGQKDGIHFGPGKRFTIRDGVFQTFDDAIALNGQDYSTSNPELGWIEDGVIENCYDLNQEKTVGYFCRMLAGGWIDWKKGMKVQQSDAVVSNGKIYRVKMEPDATLYESLTQPDFESGTKVLDGITWVMTQETITYTGGVRNVIFRNIQLEKPRIPFSIEFNMGRYNRSYYAGAEVPIQENIILDNIKVLYDKDIPLVLVSSPVNMITITNSRLKNKGLLFYGNEVLPEYLKDNIIPEFYKTSINIHGCIFDHEGEMVLLHNTAKGKEVQLKTSSNIELGENFSAKIIKGEGNITVQSDLTGLNN